MKTFNELPLAPEFHHQIGLRRPWCKWKGGPGVIDQLRSPGNLIERIGSLHMIDRRPGSEGDNNEDEQPVDKKDENIEHSEGDLEQNV